MSISTSIESLQETFDEMEKRIAELELENENLKSGITPPTTYIAYYTKEVDPAKLGKLVMKVVKEKGEKQVDGITKDLNILFRTI